MTCHEAIQNSHTNNVLSTLVSPGDIAQDETCPRVADSLEGEADDK